MLFLVVADHNSESTLIADRLSEYLCKMADYRFPRIVDLQPGWDAFHLGRAVDLQGKAHSSSPRPVGGKAVHVQHSQMNATRSGYRYLP